MDEEKRSVKEELEEEGAAVEGATEEGPEDKVAAQ